MPSTPNRLEALFCCAKQHCGSVEPLLVLVRLNERIPGHCVHVKFAEVAAQVFIRKRGRMALEMSSSSFSMFAVFMENL